MKKQLLILSISLLLIGCSSGKTTVNTAHELTHNNSYPQETRRPTQMNEVSNPIVQKKINTIIKKYLDVSITSVARSKITQTETGYQWKFMNVKTGENFIAHSDLAFASIKISKNKKHNQ